MRRFEEMNPIAVAAYYLCVLGLTMFTMDPVILALSLLSSVVNSVLLGAATKRAHIFSVILFIIAAVINPIAVHNGATVLFYINDRPFTLEATLYGLAAAGMITAALYWLRCLTKALTSDRVMYILGKAFPKLALLVSMSLRFVSLMKIRWRKISDSQKALGLYTDGNLIDAVRGRARVLSVLITWTLENGIVTAESMESRGYGSGRRTSYAEYRFHITDGLFILVCAGLTALCAAGIAQSKINFYPDISMELFSPWGITGAAAFCLLSVLPILINAKEEIKWRCLTSKV